VNLKRVPKLVAKLFLLRSRSLSISQAMWDPVDGQIIHWRNCSGAACMIGAMSAVRKGCMKFGRDEFQSGGAGTHGPHRAQRSTPLFHNLLPNIGTSSSSLCACLTSYCYQINIPEVLSSCTTIGSWDIQLPELRNRPFWLSQDVLSCIRSTVAPLSKSTIAFPQSRSTGKVYKAL
jgi:hypothetical protein